MRKLRPNKADKKTTKNSRIHLSAMKLSVAIELYFEGYTKVSFDRILMYGNRKVRVHVLAEDEVGLKVAAYCVNRINNVVSMEVSAVIDAFDRVFCDDCEVVIAIPLNLLSKAEDIIGLTGRIFAVDDDGRLWIHNVVSRRGNDALAEWNPLEDAEEHVGTAPTSGIHDAKSARFFYVV